MVQTQEAMGLEEAVIGSVRVLADGSCQLVLVVLLPAQLVLVVRLQAKSIEN